MTPFDYTRQIVMPTMLEALAARDDRRRVYLACLVVFHLADYLAAADSETETGFAGGSQRGRRKTAEANRKVLLKAIAKRCPDHLGALDLSVLDATF